ncbi:MAG: ROK family protein [Cetobacterium sp.]
MSIIAIDIGGTDIKYGLIDLEGQILNFSLLKTESAGGIKELLEKIDEIIENTITNNIIGVAISATGQIDGDKGMVIGGTDITPGWVGTNLVEIIQTKYNLPTIIENDVNCAALGEMWKGAAINTDNFICLTIGTGIGGGIILNKELFKGSKNIAGEFGHMQIVKNGKDCKCGNKGCYQEYASTNSLLKLVKEKTGNVLNGVEFFNEIHNNNDSYKKILYEWSDYFTDGLSNLIHIFNPSLIIIGGGISNQGDYLLQIFSDSLKQKVSKNYLEFLDIKVAKTGNYAGMLGASYLLINKIKTLKK